jgi:putative heme transporter
VLPLVVLAYVAIQVVESNVLVPIVMRNAIGVSSLLIILSLLVGTALGGFFGALVAVPVVAGLEAVLERLQDRHVPVAEDSAAAQQRTNEEMTGDRSIRVRASLAARARPPRETEIVAPSGDGSSG